MYEGLLLAAIGWLLLAAASHRFRRESGTRAGQVAPLRLAGALLLVAALWCCPATLPGLRWVELLGLASLAGVAVVLALSLAPRRVLAPVRWLVAPRRRDESYPRA